MFFIWKGLEKAFTKLRFHASTIINVLMFICLFCDNAFQFIFCGQGFSFDLILIKTC